MPHLVIEYSDVDYSRAVVADMMSAAHAGAMASGLFTEQDVKVRAYPCQYVLVGGDVGSTIHVTVYLLSGRDQDTQKKLAAAVLEHIAALDLAPSSLSVDCRDMDRAVYSKVTTKT
ncbi:5-carboxymethyl-2-hydroxymuconate Delta-isomerase [Kordiimonas aestuarii]|uniref:5-carboxymethyl-2-hydroxymuconate Delta-isomerase n=1 Tax=Kordiimonas aestuarii TaxID=1005925 RepID=UPI0021D0442C|nr:hypothetical protein [Kordiimonas aestuarii]